MIHKQGVGGRGREIIDCYGWYKGYKAHCLFQHQKVVLSYRLQQQTYTIARWLLYYFKIIEDQHVCLSIADAAL